MLPLNLGIRAHDLQFTDLNSLIGELKHYHLHHIQFAPTKCFPDLFDQRMPTKGLADYFAQQFNDQGIKISILGSYVNLASSDLTVRKQALTKFKKYTELTKNFNATVIGTETGSVGQGYTDKNFTEEAYQIVLESVGQLVTYAEDLGVTIAIEPGLNHPIYTSKLAKRLIQDIQSPNLKIILDFANLVSPDNYHDLDYLITQAIDDLQDSIEAIHLKDFVIENNRVKIVPVGQGLMKYHNILKFIKYQKPFIYASLEETQAPFIEPAIKELTNLYNCI
ncbi:sugar phosphate isomerase/epimerase family protein [Lapidilactobacillus bayanensis]|uniref:sugar phosphate isomerase/epimerase family protein n=1 Tax=Lapidilactobacillus bayanensis TaxID=2485998 RepID=UPI000F78B5D2|nr:sugar phosphate isomerase/epimerase family protein [Lapidilactobacillus bayanensis]